MFAPRMSSMLVLSVALISVSCKDKGDPSSAAADDPLPPSPAAVRVTETPAKAPKRPSAIDKMFKETDENSDGKITKAEARSFSEKKFEALDKNNDGVLDAAEIAEDGAASMLKAAIERLNSLDTDHDGKVAREELPVDARLRFDRLDMNNDGFVTVDDIRMRMEKTGGKRFSHLMLLDSNRDGKVTAEEHSAGRNEWFAKADRNGDGAVTIEEAKLAASRRAPRLGEPGGLGAPGGPGGKKGNNSHPRHPGHQH